MLGVTFWAKKKAPAGMYRSLEQILRETDTFFSFYVYVLSMYYPLVIHYQCIIQLCNYYP